MDGQENVSVLLLPGMDGTGALSVEIAADLRAVRSVKVIEYPSDANVGYDELVTFVEAQAPEECFVVVGESYSGPIAIEIAASTERVVGLVLASSFARYPIPPFLAPLAQVVNLSWIPDRIILAMLVGSKGTSMIKQRLIKTLQTLPIAVIRRRISEVLRVDKRNRLRDVECPVLCLHGTCDRLVPKMCVDEIAAACPNCQVLWFDAPHMLLETRPSAAAKAINNFCEQNERALDQRY